MSIPTCRDARCARTLFLSEAGDLNRNVDRAVASFVSAVHEVSPDTPMSICDKSSSRSARWVRREAEITAFKAATSEGQFKVRDVDPGSFSV
jgi:hypothetical protein